MEYDRLVVADRDRDAARRGVGKFSRLRSMGSGSDHEPLMQVSGSDKHAESAEAGGEGDIELTIAVPPTGLGGASTGTAMTTGSAAPSSAAAAGTTSSSAQASLAQLAARLGKPKYALDWSSIRHLHSSLTNREKKGFGMLVSEINI